MFEKGILATNSAIHINIFVRKFNIIDTKLPSFNDIIPKKTFAYPYKIITPDNGTAKRFDIINSVEIVLNFNTVIGKIKISADIVTASVAAIFLLKYLLNKLVTGWFKKTIPNVPKYESSRPTSFIAYGFAIIIIINEIAIELITSFFLYTTFDISIIIPIIHALTIEGENLVININNISTKIIIIYELFLAILLFVSKKLIPIIM